MALVLSDKWLWDFWFARAGEEYHLFYLQAPRGLIDPDSRHHNASIGHAVSQDLYQWQVLPTALTPGTDSWDDLATWTGSVIRHNDLWYMFYTGVCAAEEGLLQRIGLATSNDLIHWNKHPENPLVRVDPRWYEVYDGHAWYDQAWRDPCVFQHPERGDFHMLITARVNQGPADERGVIGHAHSEDLIHWEVLPPLTEPGDFGQMEVPQLVKISNRYYMLFCTTIGTTAARHVMRCGRSVTGTHYLKGASPLGPFAYMTDEFLKGDSIGQYYAGKLVQAPKGEWVFMAWLMNHPDGSFCGELSDPIPIHVDEQGGLSLDANG